ncbi:MAG: hypothetical protein ACTSW7_01655, partial [Candidatus Thorarchaeota archaeon]
GSLAILLAISKRSFHWNEDFAKVRDFLIQTYNLTKTFQNWIPSMFENTKFGPGGTEYEEDEYIKIWDADNVGIIAVTICKPSGDCRIFMHPDFRNHEGTFVESLESQRAEMKTDDSPIKMYFVVEAGDTHRENLLKQRGCRTAAISLRKVGHSLDDHLNRPVRP